MHNALALSSDVTKPCVISAKSFIYYPKKHLMLYEQAVKGNQGTTSIDGEKAWVFTDVANKINRIVLIGNPAHYRTLPDGKNTYLFAEGNKIYYYPLLEKVLLLDHGKVVQEKNTFLSPHIWYDIANQTVASKANGPKTTTIIVEPKS